MLVQHWNLHSLGLIHKVFVDVVVLNAEKQTDPESGKRQDDEDQFSRPVQVALARDGRDGDDDQDGGDESGDDDDLSAEGGWEAVHGKFGERKSGWTVQEWNPNKAFGDRRIKKSNLEAVPKNRKSA